MDTAASEKQKKLAVNHLDPIDQSLRKVKKACEKFTGEVWAYVYRPYEGYADYSIVRLRLKDGVVQPFPEDNVEDENGHRDISDPMCFIEAQGKMETRCALQLEKLRRAYPKGYQHV